MNYGLTGQVTKCEIVPGFESDHSAIVLNINCYENRRGPGLWKLNVSLLNDLKYIEMSNVEIQKMLIVNVNHNYDVQWEMLKHSVMTKSKEWAKERAIEHKNKIVELKESLLKLKEKVDMKNVKVEDELYDEYIRVEKELEKQQNYIVEGVAVRSKILWYEQGERNSKFFYGLEKLNFNNKTMKALKRENRLITGPLEILSEQHAFYDKLYTSNKATKFTYTNSFDKCLSSQEKEKLDMPITLDEK